MGSRGFWHQQGIGANSCQPTNNQRMPGWMQKGLQGRQGDDELLVFDQPTTNPSLEQLRRQLNDLRMLDLQLLDTFASLQRRLDALKQHSGLNDLEESDEDEPLYSLPVNAKKSRDRVGEKRGKVE